MKHSSDRILTTHAGSLPRPADILEKLAAKQQQAFDEPGMAERLREAVADIVRKQAELGVDIVDDGEQGKVGFIPYINERLAGFELDTERSQQSPWGHSREAKAFPEFYAPQHYAVAPNRMVCTGPVSYKGQAAVQRDIGNLKAALKEVNVAEAFLPSVSPTSVADWHRNAHYKNYEEYLYAVADAMHDEYKAITDAGLLVQIDDPHLVTQWITEPYETIEQCRKAAQMQVAALNHALRDIPEDRVRHHTCYGINIGPRVHDLELEQDRRHYPDHPRAGLFVRGRQSAPRARMEGVGDGEACRRQDSDPRRDLAFHGAGRASRTGGAAHRALCRRGRSRQRDCRLRLRLCHVRGVEGDSPLHRLGQVPGHERWRADRQQAAVGEVKVTA